MYEVIERDDFGELTEKGTRPFSMELFGPGDQIRSALKKIEMLRLLGWPDALLQLRHDDGSALIGPADSEPGRKIWILKAKPSCWRLYFYVNQDDPAKPYFLYLHAVCKRRQAQGQADSRRARTILASLGAGGNGRIRFDIPGA